MRTSYGGHDADAGDGRQWPMSLRYLSLCGNHEDFHGALAAGPMRWNDQ
jgi:hypothetical protein